MFVQLKQMLKRDWLFLILLIVGFLGFTVFRGALTVFLQHLGDFDFIFRLLGASAIIVGWLVFVLVCWRATQASFKKQWGDVCMYSFLWLTFALLWNFWFMPLLYAHYQAIINFLSLHVSSTVNWWDTLKNILNNFDFFVYNSVRWSLLYTLLAAFWEKRGWVVSLFKNFGKFIVSYVIVMILWYGISSIINFISAHIPVQTYHSAVEIPLYMLALFRLLHGIWTFIDMIIGVGMIYILTAWKRGQQRKANNLAGILDDIKHSQQA